MMTRTLPPLGASLLNSLLPVTSRTVPPRLHGLDFPDSKAAKNIQNLTTVSSTKVLENKTENVMQKTDTDDDSGEESDIKSLGDTSDVLNMTHVLSLNPNCDTASLTPINKKKNKQLKCHGKGGYAQTGLDSQHQASKREKEHVFQSAVACQTDSILVENTDSNSELRFHTSKGESGKMTTNKRSKCLGIESSLVCRKSKNSAITNVKMLIVEPSTVVAVASKEPRNLKLAEPDKRTERDSCESKPQSNGSVLAAKNKCFGSQDSFIEHSLKVKVDRKEKFVKQVAVHMTSSSSEGTGLSDNVRENKRWRKVRRPEEQEGDCVSDSEEQEDSVQSSGGKWKNSRRDKQSKINILLKKAYRRKLNEIHKARNQEEEEVLSGQINFRSDQESDSKEDTKGEMHSESTDGECRSLTEECTEEESTEGIESEALNTKANTDEGESDEDCELSQNADLESTAEGEAEDSEDEKEVFSETVSKNGEDTMDDDTVVSEEEESQESRDEEGQDEDWDTSSVEEEENSVVEEEEEEENESPQKTEEEYSDEEGEEGELEGEEDEEEEEECEEAEEEEEEIEDEENSELEEEDIDGEEDSEQEEEEEEIEDNENEEEDEDTQEGDEEEIEEEENGEEEEEEEFEAEQEEDSEGQDQENEVKCEEDEQTEESEEESTTENTGGKARWQHKFGHNIEKYNKKRTLTGSKQAIKSKHHLKNGSHNSQQFWNNVLPHYLTLK
ncbi:ABC transporter F family member 4-like [Protopterus annectens]|uniref:ABC transporter F family member 4-like n=1 Tax=Protopterus annectens TaxID=7888 RepID=UPI001CFA447D|nr:ABC transporter F family member 4-like [Protopterus annectens]